jgi:hypothetical protein
VTDEQRFAHALFSGADDGDALIDHLEPVADRAVPDRSATDGARRLGSSGSMSTTSAASTTVCAARVCEPQSVANSPLCLRAIESTTTLRLKRPR